jgi:succinate-semialdehyde dehydrogenase/glutarate-semialdehyde dehydrogenase
MTATLHDGLDPPGLLYIRGDFRASTTGETFDVENPATEQTFASVADAGPEDAIAAVDAAAGAAETWASTAPRARAELLRRAFELLTSRADEVARIIVAENGKPLADARGEAVYAAEFLRWYSEEAVRAYGSVLRSPLGDHSILAIRRPIGVSLLITPWNFPAAMITRKVGPALAAGCTVVVKPAPEAPVSALLLADIFHEAGIPPGVVNVLTTSRAEVVVPPILADPRVRKLSFTGSTQVGRLLLRSSAERVLSVSLELGGNAPFIVLADADLDLAVADAVGGKTRVSGQACTAPNRFLVEEAVHEEFTERLRAAFAQLRVGDGQDDDVDLGPLINAAAVRKVTALVDDAVARGATRVIGGTALAGTGHFFEPTVLTRVPPSAAMLGCEVFGPVAPVRVFRDLDAMIAESNETEHGLMGYIYTADVDRAMQLARRLEVGLVGIGRGLGYDPSAPFGGVKQSGLGREGGHEGLEEYLETQTLKVRW